MQSLPNFPANSMQMNVKAALDKRYLSKEGYPIVIRVTHGGQYEPFPTGWKVHAKNWNGSSVIKHPDSVVINSRITSMISEVQTYFASCKLSGEPIILKNLFSKQSSASFTAYLLHRAKQFDAKKQFVMCSKIRCIAGELTEVFGRDIFFGEINQDKLRDYDAWLIDKENHQNTRMKKFSIMQQLCTHAIDDGLTPGPNPFRKYKINKKPTKKAKLTLLEIGKLEKVVLPPGPVNDARNMALFSYYCKGARFENVLSFHRSQVHDGRIHIRMNKGNKFVSVKIHSRLQRILDQYKGEYLFAEKIPSDPKTFMYFKDRQNGLINDSLSIACSLAGIRTVKFHILRHTFADHLKKSRADIHVIKESLGHSKTSTTEEYLASLGDEEIDKDMDKLYGE